MKSQPTAGAGVSVTSTLRAKSNAAEAQGSAQLMPPGAEVTVPWPVLVRLTAVTSR